jgi:hypothetical protein
MLVPPYNPVTMLIKVIPTCMADKKFSASAWSSRAIRAPLLPFDFRFSRREVLDETTAISDNAKNPFIRKRTERTMSSIFLFYNK